MGYPEFHVPNLIYMSVVIVIALLTYFHDVNPKEACATVLIVAAIDVIGEMLFIAYMGRPDAKFQVLCECLLYTGVICIAIFAYLRIFVYLCLTAWTIAYFTCCVMLHDPVMFQTGALIFAIFLFDTYLSVSSHWCLKNILRKNAELQSDEQEVLDFFRMDKQQLLSYIRLAHDRDLSEDETQGLLESLNVESSVTISHNVAYMMRQQEMDYEKMRMRLPELNAVRTGDCPIDIAGEKTKRHCQAHGQDPWKHHRAAFQNQEKAPSAQECVSLRRAARADEE